MDKRFMFLIYHSNELREPCLFCAEVSNIFLKKMLKWPKIGAEKLNT